MSPKDTISFPLESTTATSTNEYFHRLSSSEFNAERSVSTSFEVSELDMSSAICIATSPAVVVNKPGTMAWTTAAIPAPNMRKAKTMARPPCCKYVSAEVDV